MNKGIKIVLGAVIFLGMLSGAFLFFAKKKVAPVEAPKTVQASAQVKSLNPLPSQLEKPAAIQKKPPIKAENTEEKTADRKTLMRSQWTQCKDKTIPANTNLLWSVQITEGIPAKGTYAKGNLDSDLAFPVRVVIKTESKIVDKIKTMLVVGKTAFLRGSCIDVASDGAVVLQAF